MRIKGARQGWARRAKQRGITRPGPARHATVRDTARHGARDTVRDTGHGRSGVVARADRYRRSLSPDERDVPVRPLLFVMTRHIARINQSIGVLCNRKERPSARSPAGRPDNCSCSTNGGEKRVQGERRRRERSGAAPGSRLQRHHGEVGTPRAAEVFREAVVDVKVLLSNVKVPLRHAVGPTRHVVWINRRGTVWR